MLIASSIQMNAANPVIMRRFILCCNITRLTQVLNSRDFNDNPNYLRSLICHYRRELALLDVGEYGAFSALRRELNAEGDGNCVDPAGLVDHDIEMDLPTIILDPGPGLKILFVNKAFTTETGLSRARLLGRPIYDAFPENPEALESECISHTFDSIHRTTNLKEPQILTHQRYDIGNSDGVFIECYWRMEFQPLLGTNEQVEFIKMVAAKIQQKSSSLNACSTKLADRPKHVQQAQSQHCSHQALKFSKRFQ
jgi:PAS domain-containing protein